MFFPPVIYTICRKVNCYRVIFLYKPFSIKKHFGTFNQRRRLAPPDVKIVCTHHLFKGLKHLQTGLSEKT